jgi:hypothetical protein
MALPGRAHNSQDDDTAEPQHSQREEFAHGLITATNLARLTRRVYDIAVPAALPGVDNILSAFAVQHEINRKPVAYDLCVNFPISHHAGQQASDASAGNLFFLQILDSIRVSMSNEMRLAYARRHAHENLNTYIGRVIELEMASHILFFVMLGGTQGIATLMRAATFATQGKRVVLIWDSKSKHHKGTRGAFLRLVGPFLNKTVFVYEAEERDQAVNKAIYLSSEVEDTYGADPFIEVDSIISGDSSLPNRSSQLYDKTVTDAHAPAIPRLFELESKAAISVSLSPESSWLGVKGSGLDGLGFLAKEAKVCAASLKRVAA